MQVQLRIAPGPWVIWVADRIIKQTRLVPPANQFQTLCADTTEYRNQICLGTSMMLRSNPRHDLGE